MRREARIGFAIVGCLAAVLMYAAIKRMWLLAQVARNPDPAPTIPGSTTGAPSALVARDVPPVITLPSEPTRTLVYQEPDAQEPAAAASRFAIPLPAAAASEGNNTTAEVAATKTSEPIVDTTSVEAAPPLGQFSSRFSAGPKPTAPEAKPAATAASSLSAMASRFNINAAPPTESETAPEAEADSKSNAIPSVSSLVGSLASSLATRMTGSQAGDEEETPGEPEAAQTQPADTKLPEPQQVADATQSADEPQASLRIVGEKGPAAAAEVPPAAKLIKPSPLVEAQPVPQPTAPVVTAAPRETPPATRPTWQLSSTPTPPKTEFAADLPQAQPKSQSQPKPQPRLNRAFASTADATPAKYVPAQNASTTQTVRETPPPQIDDTPRRLPPTIEVSGGAEQGITKQADPAWVQQMIESGSFIPGQRFVPTQTPQPLPIERQKMQPLTNPATAPQQPSTVPPLGTAPPHTYVVQPGDDLATIARRTLGDAARWGELFRMNRDLIGDYPDQMKPGTQLRLPQ